MATTPVSAGSGSDLSTAKTEIFNSIQRLSGWLEAHNYSGYDTFDGLSSFVRPLTFNNPFLMIALQQGVRRFPINLRPILGIRPSQSTKGMGFLARGFLRMHQATGESIWSDKAEFVLDWLTEHQSPGYSGACWGNHFDYQSRVFYLRAGTPTVVWTALIGHAFLDAWEHFGKQQYLDTAVSACEHILRDLKLSPDGRGACISYIPTEEIRVHNANTLGGSLLARTWFHHRRDEFRSVAEQAMMYTVQYQRPNGSWFYGEAPNTHWVDNFHTAYVLDCLKHYVDGTDDHQFDESRNLGYEYWKKMFFLEDGTPRYYDNKTLPIDIQCSSQAIDTLVFYSKQDPEAIPLALKVAHWTIANMQDSSGYFYYRRYSPSIVNRTPTLHWGQATMMSALGGLYHSIDTNESCQ